MNDADIIAIGKFLIQLQIDNLVLARLVLAGRSIGHAGLQGEVAAERARIEEIPTVREFLARNDPSKLSNLLSTLSAIRPY